MPRDPEAVCRLVAASPETPARECLAWLQGYLAHKKQPTSLGPPLGHRRSPTVGSQVGAVSYERGTPVASGWRDLEAVRRLVAASPGRNPPALIAGPNVLFQVLDLYWRSPKSGSFWYKSGRLKRPFAPLGLQVHNLYCRRVRASPGRNLRVGYLWRDDWTTYGVTSGLLVV